MFVSNMQGQVITLNADTLAITATHEVQADQLLNLVYDPASNRLLGVDQGIDRDDYRNHHLGHDYVKRSSGHRVFALDADSGKVLASELTDEVPIGLLLDERSQRLYVANRKGVRVDHGAGTLTVFDAKTLKRLQTVDLPPHPNSGVGSERRRAVRDGEKRRCLHQGRQAGKRGAHSAAYQLTEYKYKRAPRRPF